MWVLAAEFSDNETALFRYKNLKRHIFDSEYDLSVFRLRYKEIPQVVLVGDRPNAKEEFLLRSLMVPCQWVELDPEAQEYLEQRRIWANKIGPWVESITSKDKEC